MSPLTRMGAFRGMHVLPAKHCNAWLPRKCDYRTDAHTDRRQTKWPLVPLWFAGDTINWRDLQHGDFILPPHYGFQYLPCSTVAWLPRNMSDNSLIPRQYWNLSSTDHPLPPAKDCNLKCWLSFQTVCTLYTSFSYCFFISNGPNHFFFSSSNSIW